MLKALYVEFALCQCYRRSQPSRILRSISPLHSPKWETSHCWGCNAPAKPQAGALKRTDCTDFIWVHMSKGSPPKEVSPSVHKHLHPIDPLSIKNKSTKVILSSWVLFTPQVKVVPRLIMRRYCTLSHRTHAAGLRVVGRALGSHGSSTSFKSPVSKESTQNTCRHYLSVLSGVCQEPSDSGYLCFYPWD